MNASRSDSDHQPVICVEYCGDRTDASCSTEKAYCIPKNPVDGRQQAVCIPLTNRGGVSEGVFETVRAESHGALPIVCFTQSQREEVRELEDPCQTLTQACNTNYLVGKIEAGGTTVPNRRVHGRSGCESPIHRVVCGRHNADAEERTERREHDPGRGVPCEPDGSNERRER